MPKVRCPTCGYITSFVEGAEKANCERCNYEMTIHYTVEKIEGDPVTWLLHRAGLNNNNKTEGPK